MRGARRRRWSPHRGSSYLLVLAVSSIVLLMGLTGLQLARIEAAATTRRHETAEARVLAAAAAEHALTTIAADANWRGTYFHDVPIPALSLGNGSFSWRLVDEDEDLDDDHADPVRIVGNGSVGEALQMLAVEYDPNANPLDVLRTTMHISGAASLPAGSALTVSGGPVSTGGMLSNNGTIDGDVETAFSSGSGTITGTVIEPAPPKSMPSWTLFNDLAAQATIIPFPWSFDAPLLSASVNPYGPTDDQGIYLIVVPPGDQLKLRVKRIRATLLVDLEPDAKLKIDTPILMEPGGSGLPTLLARGNNGQVEFTAFSGSISEASVGANLNPPGTPYEGLSDGQLDDVYPAELRGLIHILGSDQLSVSVNSTLPINGTLLIDADATIVNATITHDPMLFASPPTGYTTAGGGVDPLSWQREILP